MNNKDLNNKESNITGIREKYIKPRLNNDNYLVTYTSQEIDTAMSTNSNDIKCIDREQTKAEVITKEIIISFENYDNLVKPLDVPTQKLLLFICSKLTAVNSNKNNKSMNNIELLVTFTYEEYADLIKYSIKPNSYDKTEINRSYTRKRDFKRNLNTYLNNIYSMSMNNLSENSISKHRIITGYDLEKDYVCITFTDLFYRAITSRKTLTSINKGIFQLSNIAYNLAYKIEEYYNIDGNIKRGTNNKIKIKSLLKAIPLPSIEEVNTKLSRDWKRHIKTKLDKALHELVDKKIINNSYYFMDSNDVILDVSTLNKLTYMEWENLYLCFELHEPIDHSLRLEKKKKKQEDNKSKRSKTK